MLVGSVLLYGVEVWGYGRQLRPIEEVQMRAVRIFMGVGRLHPLASLQFEMNMLPVKWEAMERSITFWVHEMRLSEGRWLKEVVREAMNFKDTVLINLLWGAVWVKTLCQYGMCHNAGYIAI